MKSGKENEKTIEFFKVISHEIRVKIISILHEDIEMTYTDILRALDLEEGNLNFHLRKMKCFLELTEKKTYKLSEYGKIAYDIFHKMDERLAANTGETTENKDTKKLSFSLIMKRTIAAFIDFSIFVSLGIVLYFISSQGLRLDVHFFHIVIYLQLTLQFTYVSFVIMESYKGQTIGKYAMNIRVIKTDGGKVTFLESAIRNIGKVFFLPLDILIGVIFYRKEGYIKFLDYYTKTTVERVL